MAGISGSRLVAVAAVGAALGSLWIWALVSRDDFSQDLVGTLLWYWPVALGSIWVFLVARRRGLLPGAMLAGVSVMSWCAGSFVAWWIWIVTGELGP